MTFSPHGKHLISGEWVSGAATFASEPAHGTAHHFSVGTPEHVEQACAAARACFEEYAATTREQRAAFLNTIADEIEARAAEITKIGTEETGLPEARLNGERGRTCGQLRLFAEHVLKGDYLDRRHDAALPDRQPAPRTELWMMQRPVGPVAVFGASNFPLAFSTAGGDTASALAVGCPVVVKGHSAHPGTAEIVADAIDAARRACNMPAGVFSLIQGGNRKVGEALVTHPAIKAVGFTGSLQGGRALFDLCAARPEPIPFFGELGSVNPMFVLPGALQAKGEEIARGWAASLTMGAGQFCTNPGIAILIAGAQVEQFGQQVAAALAAVQPQVMLTGGIASAYRAGTRKMTDAEGVDALFTAANAAREAAPQLFHVTGADLLKDPELAEEVFGPLGLLVTVKDEAELLQVARAFQGQLTCTLHLEDRDASLARQLLSILEHKAGRILVNGYPTGVEVVDSMVHGGPYPASTNFGATSVGTLAVRRFLRPVCYQNLPHALLPADLQAMLPAGAAQA